MQPRKINIITMKDQDELEVPVKQRQILTNQTHTYQ